MDGNNFCRINDTESPGIDKEINRIIENIVGPNAQSSLQQYGIEVVTGVAGTVKEAVENYIKQ